MDRNQLSSEDRLVLLKVAREAVEAAANRRRLPALRLEDYSSDLREIGTSFVTLTEKGRLRGCIGGLEASQPLVKDVQEHAAAAAVEDYRFNPVRPDEISKLRVEISRLTPAKMLDYKIPMELETILRPNIDGVIIRDGEHRATFLPQVWEKLPDVEEFLDHLCQKMGVRGNLWKTKHLEMWTYQVEAFEEE
jgi:AmmeMemoRadiSam system protein A